MEINNPSTTIVIAHFCLVSTGAVSLVQNSAWQLFLIHAPLHWRSSRYLWLQGIVYRIAAYSTIKHNAMLRFLACFGCEEKASSIITPRLQISSPRSEDEAEQLTNLRKVSQQSIVVSDGNLTSTTGNYPKTGIQDEKYISQFILRLLALNLKQRKQVEYEFVKKYCFAKGPQYAIEKPWSVQYTDFLSKNNKSALRQIENSSILQNGRIRSGLQSSKDYFVVSRKVWMLVKQLYGGGPQVEKNKMLPVRELPPFGLENNRYSCYLNSGFQTILSIPEFVDYFYHGYFKSEKHKTKYPQKPLSNLTHEMISFISQSAKDITEDDIFDLSGLRKFIKARFPSIHQHDCQEFIRFYISKLQQQLNPRMRMQSGKPTEHEVLERYQQSHTSIVDVLFHGQLNSHTKCGKCENISIAYDPIMELTLEMNSNQLEECIEQFFSPQRLIDAYECQRCLKRGKATRQFFLGKAPLYFMITVKRFLENQKKNTQQLKYPTILNFEHYFKAPQPAGTSYSLQSVVIHVGEANKGHYYILTQRQGKWYQINDEKTRRININVNLQTEAYILIYRQEQGGRKFQFH